MSEWCEHKSFLSNLCLGLEPKVREWAYDEIRKQFCPWCDKSKRPPERKKLWMLLNEELGSPTGKTAGSIVDAVIEVYEKWAEESQNKGSYLDVTPFPDYLKKELL